MTEGSWTHGEVVVNGVRLHYVEAGSGPLVVLLHGFPEFWYSWRRQLPALATAGFRAVAVDMRGYNTSGKPKGVSSYQLSVLVEDVAALVRHFAAQRAHIVGHDWGGVVAWSVAMRHPELVERLVVLNAPHPGAFLREARRPGQLRRSWYVLFFQLPWLPEATFRSGNYRLLRRVLQRQPLRAGAFTEDDINRYVEALAQPGALTAAISYYRATFRQAFQHMRHSATPVTAPTLLIWGERDPYLGIRLTQGLEHWAPNSRVERIPDASHWVQHDAPERVNELLVGFLKGT
ncbi:MAG: alpha/beta hydrolase [Dehalococcoidia bacterium]|nr:alpha/beta hydrolase [Dehalococcoidia bacterium]